MSDEILVNSKEAARRIGISKRFYLSIVSSGKIPQGIQLGRRRLWPVKDLEQWVDGMVKKQNEISKKQNQI